MDREKKDYSRSVRMTKTVFDIVMEHEGEGFNEKFENMVLHCKKAKPELDQVIAERHEQLKALNKKIAAAKAIVTDLDNLKWSVSNVIKTAQNIVEKGESLK